MSYYSPSTKGWNSEHNRPGSNTLSQGSNRTNTARDLSSEDGEDIGEGEGAQENSLSQNWRAVLHEARQKKELGNKENQTEAIAEKGFRLGTYGLYRLAWQFMFSLWCLPILYLWIHFLARYIGSFKGFSDFVNPYGPAGLKEIIQKDDKGNTDLGWMLVFIFLSFVVLAILVLVAAILYILVKSYTISKTELFFSAGKGWIIGGKEGSFEAMIEYILRH